MNSTVRFTEKQVIFLTNGNLIVSEIAEKLTSSKNGKVSTGIYKWLSGLCELFMA